MTEVTLAELLGEPFDVSKSAFQGRKLVLDMPSRLGPGLSKATFVIGSRLGAGMKAVVYSALGHLSPDAELTQTSTPEHLVLKIPRIYPSSRKNRSMPRQKAVCLHRQKLQLDADRYNTPYSEWHYISPRLQDVDCAVVPLTVAIGQCHPSDSESPFSLLISVQEEVRGMTCLDSYLATVGGSSEWLKEGSVIASSLLLLHQRRIVHGDIWPPNIFISQNKALVKFIDFGESWDANIPSEVREKKAWQHPYLAPERTRLSMTWKEAVDVYSFGVLLLWLACGGLKTRSRRHSLKYKSTDGRRVVDLTRSLSVDLKSIGSVREETIKRYEAYISGPGYEVYEKFLKSSATSVESIEEHFQDFALLEKVLFWDELATDSSRERRLDAVFNRLQNERRDYGTRQLLAAGKEIVERAGMNPGIPQASERIDRYEIRAEIRQRVADSDKVSEEDKPWLVDLIASCCDLDPARRPRMQDVVRSLDHRVNGEITLAGKDTISTELTKILQRIDQLKSEASPSLLWHMASYRLNEIRDMFGVSRSPIQREGSLDGRMLDIYDHRDSIIDHLSWLFEPLGPGSWFATQTTLSVWHVDGYGIDGRYLTSNLHALRKGACLIRNFSISVEALGASWWFDLLLRVACQGMEGKESDLEELQREMLRGTCETLETKCKDVWDESKVMAFKKLVSALDDAEKRLRHSRGMLALQSPPFSRDLPEFSLTVSGRNALRKRFSRVLRSYSYLITSFNRDVKLIKSEMPPDFRWDEKCRKCDASLSKYNNGLYLGFTLVPRVDDAMELYSKNSQSVISHDDKILLFETECRGRNDEVFNPSPTLARIRMFEPFNPQAPETRKRLYHSMTVQPGQVEEDDATQVANFNHRELKRKAGGSVNIGPLIEELLVACDDLINGANPRPSALRS